MGQGLQYAAGYWFYVVYDCATPSPRLVRVHDPFGSLLAKSKEAF